jgi:hypothetical protein
MLMASSVYPLIRVDHQNGSYLLIYV